MNPIIVPTRNNLHLTRRAVDTFRKQDIEGGAEILIIENHSTDGTQQWLQTQKDLPVIHNDPPMSVAESWNIGLQLVFDKRVGAEYALVVNNDVELRPDTYRWLVEDGGGFVTAVGTMDAEKIKPMPTLVEAHFGGPDKPAYSKPMGMGYPMPDPAMKRNHPDFSCFLIRREVYEQVGPFDEEFKIAFVEDGDYDLRLYKAGIRAYCLDLPFLHHGSATIKNADPVEVKRIQVQADKNRKYFERKWGFRMASEAYYKALDKGGPPTV